MEIRTKRLLLRPWKESDCTSLYEYAKDPRVGPMAGWPIHTSISNSQEIIQTILAKDESYAVCLQSDNKAIGSIGLMIGGSNHLSLPITQGEIGYWIGVPFWGQGYIPEAVHPILQHGFNDKILTSIWCGYYDGNTKSKRVQEKCGFLYHHTVENVACDAINEIRTEHFSCITKEHWDAIERINK